MPTFPDTDSNGPAWSAAWAEAQASADPAHRVVDTLEFRHADLTTPVRVVHDTEDLTATLEDDAPENGGEAVTFTACAFSVTLPGMEALGKAPQLEIVVDNIGRDLMDVIRAAVRSRLPIYVRWRSYLKSDTTGPAIEQPIDMVVSDCPADVQQVRCRAALGDPGNRKFPRVEYLPSSHPALSASST